jgi:hypothetical protein
MRMIHVIKEDERKNEVGHKKQYFQRKTFLKFWILINFLANIANFARGFSIVTNEKRSLV